MNKEQKFPRKIIKNEKHLRFICYIFLNDGVEMTDLRASDIYQGLIHVNFHPIFVQNYGTTILTYVIRYIRGR